MLFVILISFVCPASAKPLCTNSVTKKPFKYMGFNGKAYARGRGKVSLKRALRIRK